MSATALTGSRVTTVVIGALVAGVLAVTALGFVDGRRGGVAAAPAASPTPAITATATATATPDASPTGTPPVTDTPVAGPLTASVIGMRAVTGRATQPGDVAGPAISFTIRIVNDSGAAVDLSNAVVNATVGAAQSPAYALESGSTAFPAVVQPGHSVTGVFVFTVPLEDRHTVSVTVDVGSARPMLAFTGSAPRS